MYFDERSGEMSKHSDTDHAKPAGSQPLFPGLFIDPKAASSQGLGRPSRNASFSLEGVEQGTMEDTTQEQPVDLFPPSQQPSQVTDA